MLRNHRVGSTCSVAASGPRLATVILIRGLPNGLGGFHENVEIAVAVEDSGVEQFVFEILPSALPLVWMRSE